MTETRHDHILVIGASGSVGSGAVQFLVSTEGIQFTVSSSTRTGAAALASRYGVHTRVLDLGDSAGFARLMTEYRYVIQAAGPASLVSDRVRTAALAAGAMVVDVTEGGSHADVTTNGDGRYIHSAGIYPGLTELWTDHVISTNLDECQEVEIYLAGNGGFSITGNLDVLASLADSTIVTMARLVDQHVAETPSGIRSVILPPPIGRVRAVPVVGPGLRALAARHDIDQATYHNTFSKPLEVEQMIGMRAELDAGTPSEELATRMSARNPPAYENGHCMVFVSARGLRGGVPSRTDGAILLPTDWNTGSGWVAAATLLSLTAKGGPGDSSFVCRALDVVDSAAVVEALASHGAKYRITTKEL